MDENICERLGASRPQLVIIRIPTANSVALICKPGRSRTSATRTKYDKQFPDGQVSSGSAITLAAVVAISATEIRRQGAQIHTVRRVSPHYNWHAQTTTLSLTSAQNKVTCTALKRLCSPSTNSKKLILRSKIYRTKKSPTSEPGSMHLPNSHLTAGQIRCVKIVGRLHPIRAAVNYYHDARSFEKWNNLLPRFLA